MKFRKIALGSAQFGLKYGINNKKSILSNEEVSKILGTASSSGIDLIDTAHGYGDAELKIGNYQGKTFRIITKLPPVDDGYNQDWLNKSVQESLQKLKKEHLYGILLHRPSDLLSDFGQKLYDDLIILKEKGTIKKIGISIYETTELESLVPNYKFDIVQAPLNIFDRRLITSGWLKKLKDLNIEVHVRSIFLQGLLLMDSESRPAKFKRWDALFSEYDKWLKNNNIQALEACIQFALSLKEVDQVIIGIDSISNLREILSFGEHMNLMFPENLSSDDTDLLNPLAWLNI